jgi:hypothetical protein
MDLREVNPIPASNLLYQYRMSGFPYWRGSNPFAIGALAAAQTLNFDAATNELTISDGNTVVLTPTDLIVAGLLDVGQTLTIVGASTLGDGFLSNGDSTITRAVAGADARLVVRNFDGDGVSINAKDGGGTVSLFVVSSGSETATAGLTLDQNGVVIISKNNIVGAPTTQRPNPQNGVVNATPGSLSFTVVSTGAPFLQMSDTFAVDITHIYRWTFTIFNTSTTATTGELQIGIYDDTATNRQTMCFSAPNTSLLSAAGIAGGFTGIFQPAAASVAFFGQNVGGNANVIVALGSGRGAAAFTWFLEDLGPA